jgi:hypothetical protein
MTTYRSKNFRTSDGEWEWSRLQDGWRTDRQDELTRLVRNELLRVLSGLPPHPLAGTDQQ